ncbi:MAG: lipoprotein [Herbaspirillum sp.]|jgi:outer membrane protein assembly factor BamE (lipoprotein component of BamABCDE complex)|nr:lipoprotein [Herbaspirillum sp.]
MSTRIRKLFALLAAVLASLLAVGCDQNGRPIEEFGLSRLHPGESLESDVRNVMGQPDTVWDDADGGRTLEYPKGPEGARTWMFSIGRDGKLIAYAQVLTEENFAKIQRGMRREEVRRMLGKPRSVVTFERKNEEVWDWKYLENYRGRLFNVHFDRDSGEVAGTSSSDIYSN